MRKWINIRRLKGQCQAGGLPSYICKYIEGYESRPGKRTPLEELRLVVFDTETTGFNHFSDRILEIGAVVIQDGEIILGDSFEVLLEGEKMPGEKNILVHGLMPGEIRLKGTSSEKAFSAFLDYIHADVLVAHHARFDVNMVEMGVRKMGIEDFFLYNPTIDTALMAQKVDHPHRPSHYIDQRMYGLDALCERYGISTEDRHTAWGDALITAKLFLTLARDLKDGQGIVLGDLMK
ncbi:MAG: 3'-5' exonuclease [Bacteroidota bacterium]